MELFENTEWGAVALIMMVAYYVFTRPDQFEKYF